MLIDMSTIVIGSIVLIIVYGFILFKLRKMNKELKACLDSSSLYDINIDEVDQALINSNYEAKMSDGGGPIKHKQDHQLSDEDYLKKYPGGLD